MESDVDVVEDADTGANFNLFSVKAMKDMSVLDLELETTEMPVKGFDSPKICARQWQGAVAAWKSCSRRNGLFQRPHRVKLSVHRSMYSLRIIHSGFTTQQVNSLKKNENMVKVLRGRNWSIPRLDKTPPLKIRKVDKTPRVKMVSNFQVDKTPQGTARTVDKTPCAKKMDRFQCKKDHVF